MKIKDTRRYIAIFVCMFMITSGFGFLAAVAAPQDPVEPNSIPDPIEPRTVDRCVLLEDFTEWKCGFCPARNAAIRALLEGTPGYGYDVVAPIYYHVWWPAGDDPMYAYNPSENAVRANYYGVPAYGVPMTWYDGHNLGQDNAIQAHVDSRLAIPADISITSSGFIDDVLLTGDISVHITAEEDIADTDLVVHFGLWEHNITRFPGGNEPEYPWVMWDMIPTAAGTPIWSSGATAGQSVDITHPFTIESEWNVSLLGMSIWVQSVGSLDVKQAHVEQFDFVNTLPNATLLDNNGQAEDGTWAGTQTVRWIAEDPDEPDEDLNIHVEYSPNNGANWYTIENGVNNNDGECPWDTWMDVDGTEYLLKVTVRDNEPLTTPVSDESDAVFTIDNTPWIDLTVPDGGEMWMGGSAQDIIWDMGDFYDPINALTVNLFYSTNGGGSYPNVIASGLTGFGSNPCTFNWDPIPTIDNNLLRVRAEVVDTHMVANYDDSIGNFEIDSTAPLPATSPYAELTGANDVTIYWTASPSADVDHYEIWFIQNGWDPTGDTYGWLDTAIIPAGTTTYVKSNWGKGSNNGYACQIRTYDTVGHETRTLIQAAKFGRGLGVGPNPSDWWALGSCLVQSDTSLAHVIQGQGFPGAWDYAMAWDAQNQAWISNIPGRPSSLNELTDITNEMGFWLHTTANTRFTTAGYVSDMSIDCYAGWNMVPYPFAQRYLTTNQLELDLLANCPNYVPGSLGIFDYNQPYVIKMPDGTETIPNEEGLWIQVTADTIWTATNY